ncbi:MAG: Gfo/Idh/MocA family oxidoreductase [Deltaproteobacteria bacterium]|nr:Gfo/Idh/MocA family oxidoreductase [Deltaproteobacteria bacterium]
MTDEFRVGMVGLGAAARIVIPGLIACEGTKLVAVCDLREEERRFYKTRFGLDTYSDYEEMCRQADINVVYVATPNELHAQHAIIAAEHGKHVICEKPMAITLDEAHRMIEAVERNNVRYVQGHSKIFRPTFRKMGEIIVSGRLGRVIQIHTWMYNDWMIRPMLAGEVDEKKGGGVVFRQGPHHMDIARYLGGGKIRSLRAMVGRHMPIFDIEGNYSAFLEFEEGAAGLLGFNGYGFFDVAEMTWGIGEGGSVHSDEFLYGPRAGTHGPVTTAVRYSHPMYSLEAMEQRMQPGSQKASRQDFFGVTIVSCEKGDIRQSPDGLYVYTQGGREEVAIEPDINIRGASELNVLRANLERNEPIFPDAYWGRASLEACLAMIQSSRERRQIDLRYQSPSPLLPALQKMNNNR